MNSSSRGHSSNDRRHPILTEEEEEEEEERESGKVFCTFKSKKERLESFALCRNGAQWFNEPSSIRMQQSRSHYGASSRCVMRIVIYNKRAMVLRG